MFKMGLILRKTHCISSEIQINMDLVRKYMKKSSGNCKFKINGIIFDKKYATNNTQRQIRIYGNKELYKFFQKNFKLNSLIEIEFLEFY